MLNGESIEKMNKGRDLDNYIVKSVIANPHERSRINRENINRVIGAGEFMSVKEVTKSSGASETAVYAFLNALFNKGLAMKKLRKPTPGNKGRATILYGLIKG